MLSTTISTKRNLTVSLAVSLFDLRSQTFSGSGARRWSLAVGLQPWVSHRWSLTVGLLSLFSVVAILKLSQAVVLDVGLWPWVSRCWSLTVGLLSLFSIVSVLSNCIGNGKFSLRRWPCAEDGILIALVDGLVLEMAF
ncbi:hypothetical protein WN943_017081 [Citrus x changshan-huyou]